MYSSAFTVHGECDELAEIEVCIVHVCKIGEHHEYQWKNL